MGWLIFLPFQLFLLAYAILGPLHYFTEINWIRDKNYFVPNKRWIYVISGFALLLALPIILKLPLFSFLQENTTFNKIQLEGPMYLNILFFVGISIAISLVSFKTKKEQYITIGVGLILAILLYRFTLYRIIFGIFLPTIIHVYFFTILFMWYGNLKKNNKTGYFNVILMLLIPLVMIVLSVHPETYSFSDQVKANYINNNFHILNANISGILGLTDGTEFFFYEVADLKIQMFIAFAYTYHYLNWFSKTTIIGWHKKLTTQKSVVILILWALSIGLYFYDYKIGIGVLLFFSFLHVFMELPLNVISVKEIGKSIFKE